MHANEERKTGARGLLWAATLALMMALASCGTSGKPGSAADPAAAHGQGSGARRYAAVPVQATIVTFGRLETNHTAAGTIVPVTESQVAAQVSGVVTQVLHLAGAWVQKGEVVVRLDDSQLEVAVASARAALESAQIAVQRDKAQADLAELTVKRDQSLIAQKLIPQSQLDVDATSASVAEETHAADEAAVKEAESQLRVAQLNLAYSSITAPFAGQLASVNVTPGEFVGQNTSVFALVSPEREITFDISPGDASVLPAGASLDFIYRAQSYPARVSEAPSAPIDGVVPMVALLSSSALPPYGAVGTVSYPLSLAQGVLVPISALQTTGNQEYVYVVQGGKSAAQKLTVIAEAGTTAAVAGVPSGSQVILNPPPGLLAGSPVKPVGGTS